MTRHHLNSIRLSLVLLAVSATAASAQRVASSGDSLAVITQSDSLRPSGGGWLVALLKKIARRSDDSVAIAVASASDADSDRPATEASVTANVTRRVFTSRKDSLAYESARTSADRASGYRIV